METIDINTVAGLQALDSEGNVLGVVSIEQLTDMVAGKLATELAAQNTAPAMRTMSLQASPAAASVSATGVDKPEQQLLDVSDPKYVRVIGPDGNSGKQGISQFAQVVGGLFTSYKTWPFADLGTDISDKEVDFNTIIKPGTYSMYTPKGINRPTSIKYGGMAVFTFRNFIFQLAFDIYGSIEFRGRNPQNNWGLWYVVLLDK